jgi:hypothetical protein
VNWPSGVQWEWAIGEFLVLGLLIWELRRLRASQRQDREKAEAERLRQAETGTSES